MKNKFKKLLILTFTAIGLVGCTVAGGSSDVFSSSNTSLSSNGDSSNLSSIDDSSNDDSSNYSSSDDEPDFDENTVHTSESWDETIYKMIEFSCGEVGRKVPKISGSAYQSYFEKVSATDLYSNPIEILTTRVLCGGISSAAAENYGTTLENSGFVYSSDYDCYYAKASATDCIYVTLSFFKKTERLNIQIYRKTIRYNIWDDEVPYYVIGRSIPHIEAPAYEYYFDQYTISLYVYFVDINNSDITKYQNQLVADGWYRSSTSATDDTYVHSKDSDLKLTLEQGLDSFNDTYLMVHLENAWPLYLILSSTGGDLPKSSFGSYYGYTTNESASGQYYTQIEYDGCSHHDYVSYANELTGKKYNYSLDVIEGSGTNPGSYESSTEGYGTVYYGYYKRAFDDGTYAYVDLMYSSGLQRLLIIIWA